MFKNPLVRCVSRLLTLAVMLGALTLLTSTQKVRAALDDTCDSDYGYCIFKCAPLTGSAYDACKAPCEENLIACESQQEYEPTPAPYPLVSHDFQSCMTACGACNSIEDLNDRLDCSGACFNWCNDHYPRS